MAPQSLNKARLFFLFAGAAVLFGLLDAAQMRAQWAFNGYPGGFWLALRAALPPWLALLLLAPGVWVVSRQFRLDREPRAQSLAAHVGASLVFATLHVGMQAANAVTIGGYEEGFAEALSHLVGFYSVSRVLTYWAIAAGIHAFFIYREGRTKELRASQLEARLQDARLDALRSQLNPHFLFNALNGLSTLALRGDREAVADGLSRVSDMLRATLTGTPHEVPLRQELELIEQFLGLQELRFGDRLTVLREIAPDTMDALVPSMILQPLVENALRHGIARIPGPGRLTLRSIRSNGRIEIQVEDTGPGFDSPPGVEGGSGIGLGNTRARLEQLYGSEASLTTGPGTDGGALVSLTIPYHT